VSAPDAAAGAEAGVVTVAAACGTHAAAQDKPATRATYRSRLRPVTDRWGAVTAAEAVAGLTEIQGELTAALGEERARKTLVLLKKALTRAGHDPAAGLIGLVAARDEHHVAIASLQALVDLGKIRHREKRPHGRGTSILFDRAELAVDLAALPHCLATACEKPGTGATGYCGDHFGEAGRERAAIAERELLGPSEREWYIAEEAAAAAPCSRTLVLEAIVDRTLPAVKVGRHWHIPRRDLHEWAGRLAPAVERQRPTADEIAIQREQVRHLHEKKKLERGVIARKLGISRATVNRRLDELGAERPGRGRSSGRIPPAERAHHEQRVVDLYQQGKSYGDIAADEDVSYSATQVGRILKSAGVEIRPPGRQPKYTPPDERRCEWCRQPFVPPFPASDTRSGEPRPMRFDSDICAREWRTAQGKAALAARGLLSTGTVAREIGVGQRRVWDLIKRGFLASERVAYPGMLRPAHGVAPEELKRFLREWACGGDGRREAPLDPVKAVAAAERRGTIARSVSELNLTPEEARDVIRGQVQRRRRALAQRRKGRKPASAPPARVLRWAERFEHFRAELADLYRENPEQLDGAPPTAWQAYLAVAEEDWREYPVDWPRDRYPPAPRDGLDPYGPEELDRKTARPAANRVMRAIKRLQTAHA
jgi:excisionase family DNA binding protein